MKLIVIISFILLNINTILAQQNFNGQILNKKYKLPISGANILIKETKANFVSDDKGNFVLKNLSSGNYQISISHLNYIDTSFLINIQEINKPILIYLNEKITRLDEVNITGMRQKKQNEDIPARIDIISEKEIGNLPNSNIDNLLQSIPNVYVNRSWGIFSKNSSVTMRGMDGTSRVLVLLDGTPLNFSAGGGINWHLLESGQIEKMEVLKGPASALYGNNAMGGVINILTKKDQNRFTGAIDLFGGTYNTIGGELNIANNFIKNEKGFYWTSNAFYRQGDGYIIVPEDQRDSTDVKLGLKELSLNLLTGYQINNKNKIDIGFQYYDDFRDQGIKIYEKDGSYLKYTTQDYQLSYTGNISNTAIYLKSFYHIQNYYEHSERLNQTGDTYKLFDRKQLSEDEGFWLNLVRKISSNDEISFGSDYKHGSMTAEDIYFTSTDYFKRGGAINYYALFVQNELNLLDKKMIVSLGLRVDMAEFKNGYLKVEEPTLVTLFESQLNEKFEETSWSNLSPKIAVQYKFNPKFRLYASFSTGFMPPIIDDMVSSRKITKGFKIANPHLKPETLINYEIGFDYKPIESLKFQVSTYYSIGKDFQYFAATGDTVDATLPVYKRENLAKAEMTGIESSVEWKIVPNISFRGNYTYNHSHIVEFKSKTDNPGDDLTGKYLSETPPHQAFCGLFYTNKIVDFNIIANYISQMWADEFNTSKLDAYSTIDIRLQKRLSKFNLSLDIQNILNNQYIDKKNGLSPGRFTILKIGYRFSKNN